ncbi:pyridoxal-phosphate dependent enzyme [Streptomyces sp. NBC_01803]|uniref:pyridoxal-phosphate dependent enzyme n=1 Tax=Streptomyces sp. NBC_01803 TaxID=2975946 RepID=UPI002DDA02F2|nr:pyridoxal-phosphate dependent enzyme [Streptomyces sp. NBC_01803]WSA45262.1 pyridoxal-phosphate dependent enzyme [Streptomyces sp. NBC_01803]
MPDSEFQALPGGPPAPLTPVVTFQLSVDGLPGHLWLKLESHNAHGSVKDRTARALWRDVAERIDPDAGIIESTSGNLGVALAALAASHGVPFTAVMDPRSPASLVAAIRALRGHVITVDRPDGAGGYLLSRLAHIRERLAAQPRLVWPNQYANPANPRAHTQGTAPELRAQTHGRPARVLVAVSTGGTLAGFRDYLTAARPDWELIGVDITGSAALGGPPGPRVLSGIGASRPSAFLPGGYRQAVHVSPRDAVGACLWLADTTGITVGASSGALIAAALRMFRAGPGRTDIACLCPDGGDHYRETVYSPRWRRLNGITPTDIARGIHVVGAGRPPVPTPTGTGGAP